MSCPGDLCGHGGAAVVPVLDLQGNVAQGAALGASERNMRMVHVLGAGAPVTVLPTRVVVPASLQQTSARDADAIDGAGFVVRDE